MVSGGLEATSEAFWLQRPFNILWVLWMALQLEMLVRDSRAAQNPPAVRSTLHTMLLLHREVFWSCVMLLSSSISSLRATGGDVDLRTGPGVARPPRQARARTAVTQSAMKPRVSERTREL